MFVPFGVLFFLALVFAYLIYMLHDTGHKARDFEQKYLETKKELKEVESTVYKNNSELQLFAICYERISEIFNNAGIAVNNDDPAQTSHDYLSQYEYDAVKQARGAVKQINDLKSSLEISRMKVDFLRQRLKSNGTEPYKDPAPKINPSYDPSQNDV